MNEQQVRNLEAWTAWFAEPVAKLRDQLQKQPEPSVWMREHLRSELGVYGLCLAQHRDRRETATGIENLARLNARAKYCSAMKELTEALELPDDGSELIGSVSTWRLAIPQSRADRIERAKEAVAAALLEYAEP